LDKKLKNRYFILCLGFMVFGFIIIFRLFNLQIVEGEKYVADSQKRILKEGEIEAPRGKILDRYGTPIAVNRQGYALYIVKTNISTSEMNDMLLRLSNLLEKNGEGHVNTLSKFLKYGPPVKFNNMTEKQIRDWQKNSDRLNMKEEEVTYNASELFEYLRNEKFKIDPFLTDEQAYRIMVFRYEILINNWNFSTGGMVPLARDVSMETVAEIEERHHEFPGIITMTEPVREYIDAYEEAHILGYIRAINSRQYDELKDEGYDNDDLIGQTGVEKSAERYLRGKNGRMTIEVDADGRPTRKLVTMEAVPGHDVILTIDTNLQKVAMDSLAYNIERIRNDKRGPNYGDACAGSAVVLDVNSAAVLAMVSYPSFDPAIYLAGSENTEAQQMIIELTKDEQNLKALLNRAIQENYAPGSTFKAITAIAGLEKGVITPASNTIVCRGTAHIGGRDLFCLEKPTYGHGPLTLKRGLETSCNLYFYELGVRTGIESLTYWANCFGLGRKTGIDLPNEVSGTMSSIELKKKLRNDIWRPADTAQVSIGQFDNSFTPLQMANYAATLANGGMLYRPYVIKEIVKYDGSVVNRTEPAYTQLPLKESTIAAVKEGMVAVTSSIDGTAQEAFRGLPFEVAGKTGSAQTQSGGGRSPNGIFICYAPADDPQIAIAVIVERGVWGSNVAPVARDIIDEYFGLKAADSRNTELKPEKPLFNP
jgi:penicillin-binding protein 2